MRENERNCAVIQASGQALVPDDPKKKRRGQHVKRGRGEGRNSMSKAPADLAVPCTYIVAVDIGFFN